MPFNLLVAFVVNCNCVFFRSEADAEKLNLVLGMRAKKKRRGNVGRRVRRVCHGLTCALVPGRTILLRVEICF